MLKVNKILENVFEVANVFNDKDLLQILEKFQNCTKNPVFVGKIYWIPRVSN